MQWLLNQEAPGFSRGVRHLGQRYTGDVFKQYFSGQIDSVRASEMLHSKVDHLPRLEAAFFRGGGLMVYILDTNIIRKLLFHFPKKGKLFEAIWASLEADIEAETYISVDECFKDGKEKDVQVLTCAAQTAR